MMNIYNNSLNFFRSNQSPFLDTDFGIYYLNGNKEITKEEFDNMIKCVQQKLDPNCININLKVHSRGSRIFTNFYFHPLHLLIQCWCGDCNEKWLYKMIQFLFQNGATVESMIQFQDSGFYEILNSIKYYKRKITKLFLKNGVLIEQGLQKYSSNVGSVKNLKLLVLTPYYIYFFFI